MLPWWISGIILASVMVLHYLTTNRLMAVSGRITALVNRLRYGPDESDEVSDMSEEELAALLRDMTASEFGADADIQDDEERAITPITPIANTPISTPVPMSAHLSFFLGVSAGGLLTALLTHRVHVTASLNGSGFASIIGGSLVAPAALLVGGVLVGFGTRMAGGCTSGHGMCGASRFQKGSLLATCTFFGTAILTAFLMGGLS